MSELKSGVMSLCLLWQLVALKSETPPLDAPCLREPTRCINASSIQCTDVKYRTLSGACNNPVEHILGMQYTPYQRLLPAKYGDNLFEMPTACSGNPLPSARLIASTVFGRNPIPDPNYTLLNMQWGQLVTHDTSTRFADGIPTLKRLPIKEQECCNSSGQYEVRNSTSFCFPVAVPEDDPYFTDRQCLDFDRSVTDKDQECPGTEDPAPAQQLNGVTHFLDMSFTYGSSVSRSNRLRSFVGGFLKTRDIEQKWAPQTIGFVTACAFAPPGGVCYDFGDVRGNQSPGLAVLQLTFMREHNRLARELAAINPHWNDETLFQEARRINIAQYQYITYYEWNINFYGAIRMFKEGLIYKTKARQYVNDYNPCADPRSEQAFHHASFRNFHNLAMGYYLLISEQRRIENATILSDVLNNPGFLEEGCKYSSMVRGLSTQNAALSDANYDIEVAEKFPLGGAVLSQDLRTFDVQRGRDHGLPPYNDYRDYCGLKRATCWEDFSDYISIEDIVKLQEIYESFEDVDLSVGGALERHVKDSLVGPTFLCINLQQFKNYRIGDRYFFENGDQPYPFSPDQLAEIRKSSAARLMCDNSEIEYMQPEAFKTISWRNHPVPCSMLPKIELRKWRDLQSV